jgi:Fe-S-cluster containining protein
MSAEYTALVDKVDAFVASASERRRESLHCQRGCEACCHVSLSVGPVEAGRVRAGLATLSAEARGRVRERARSERERVREEAEFSSRADLRAAPETRCVLLEDDGSCAIYAYRPLVCRSQGQALRYPQGFVPEAAVRLRTKAGDVTWCPLNYKDAEPRAEDVLDAERVDQILAVVTRRHVATADDALARVGLIELAGEE